MSWFAIADSQRSSTYHIVGLLGQLVKYLDLTKTVCSNYRKIEQKPLIKGLLLLKAHLKGVTHSVANVVGR